VETQNVFIVGAKGIPAKYGGYESFVEQLTKRKISDNIHYFVACRRDLSDNKSDTFVYNNATCFNVSVPNVGPARAILYDLKALNWSIKYIKEHNVSNPIVYVLACRIGPFISKYKKQLKQLGGKLYVNPDGHEWLRAKWSKPVREYWKISEKLMVKHADLLICDSQNIEKYIKSEYSKYSPKTMYISYGADIRKSALKNDDEKVVNWFNKYNIKKHNYYLIVGRFVPENNYETMIREFMKTNTKKDLVIISNVEKNNFYFRLEKETNFKSDQRIKFVGTVYDGELLKFIRENAYAYLHGHEVGGTNPSLLEALSATPLNLLLKVGFNEEVGQDGALYWSKQNLAKVIKQAESLKNEDIKLLSEKALKQVETNYSWEKIVLSYEKQFLGVRG
jgi:rhamnosyltransferase